MEQKLPSLEAKKSLGQHFLNNTHVPEAMADAGNIHAGDTILEIGPGTGVLTRALLKRNARVIAIEADKRAVASLAESFKTEISTQQLIILHGDVRTIDLVALGLRPRAFKIIANIPYYLSGMLFRLFLENEIQPTDIVFLVQKEVAQRIARDPKESILSLSVKVFGTPKYIKTVGKGNFTPSPKIDSAIIAITNISKARFAETPENFFFATLHEGFKSKRKQLFGNLSGMYPRDVLEHIFSAEQLSPKVRGEDLPLDTWLSLVHALFIHRKTTHFPQS